MSNKYCKAEKYFDMFQVYSYNNKSFKFPHTHTHHLLIINITNLSKTNEVICY